MPTLSLPDSNKVPGDSNHTSDSNQIIEAIKTVNTAVDNISAGPQGPQGNPGADRASRQGRRPRGRWSPSARGTLLRSACRSRPTLP